VCTRRQASTYSSLAVAFAVVAARRSAAASFTARSAARQALLPRCTFAELAGRKWLRMPPPVARASAGPKRATCDVLLRVSPPRPLPLPTPPRLDMARAASCSSPGAGASLLRLAVGTAGQPKRRPKTDGEQEKQEAEVVNSLQGRPRNSELARAARMHACSRRSPWLLSGRSQYCSVCMPKEGPHQEQFQRGRAKANSRPKHRRDAHGHGRPSGCAAFDSRAHGENGRTGRWCSGVRCSSNGTMRKSAGSFSRREVARAPALMRHGRQRTHAWRCAARPTRKGTPAQQLASPTVAVLRHVCARGGRKTSV
jgi:hypothetical protein